MLQKKVRNASANGKSIDVSKSPTNRKDVSTSTEDLGMCEFCTNIRVYVCFFFFFGGGGGGVLRTLQSKPK